MAEKQYEQSAHKTDFFFFAHFETEPPTTQSCTKKVNHSSIITKGIKAHYKLIFVPILTGKKNVDVNIFAYYQKCDVFRNTVLLLRTHLFIINEVKGNCIFFPHSKHVARGL